MKNTFVLDENIVILAELGQDERGNPDTSSAMLIKEIASRCHAIALDYLIWQKYYQQATLAPRVIKVLMTMLRDERKLNFLSAVNPIQHEIDVPRKDIQFVRVTVQASAILVTTDGPLTESLKKEPLKSEYRISVFRPEAALPHAQSPCP